MTYQKKDLEGWVNLFTTLYENGVNTLHSSMEYESFPMLCEVLNQVSKKSSAIKFNHIIKLSDPSFDENFTNYDRIRNRVKDYLKAFNCEQIETIQWMWRADLNNDKLRIDNFRGSIDSLNNVVASLKQEGLTNEFYCFPYTLDFGLESLNAKEIDGYTVYRNPNELEMDVLLDRALEVHKSAYVIRPLGAGALVNDSKWDAKSLINFAHNHQAVKGIIVGISDEKHLSDILLGL
jgi:hypothetical protein